MIPLLMLAALPQQTGGAILIDRNRIDRAAPPAASPSRRSRAPRAPMHVTDRGADVPIAGIAFQGAQAPAPVAAAARGFLGQRASTATLQQLAAALSAAYTRSRVALYTVAIPEQDFARGVVRVILTEGRLASANVRSDKRHPLLAARMAPLLEENPLSRGTFERQLTLMRAIPGMTIDVDLADPQNTGALAMTVTPHQRRTKLSFGFTNRGVDLLGAGQFDARGDVYGLARDGDDLSLAASAASDLRRYRFASGGYSVPLTPSGLTLSAAGAYLETRPKGYALSGNARQASLGLSYPLLRSFHRAADLSLGVDLLDSDNALFGTVIAAEHTRAVRASAGYSEARERRSFEFSGSLSQGLDVLGARVPVDVSEATFTKGTVAASISQAIGARVVARLSATAQYSRDRLPAAERFSLGGDAIGRAFDIGVLTGDRGAGGSAELGWRPVHSDRFGNSELYGFVDGGVVGVLARVPGAVRADYSLASAGAGVRLRYREKAELGLEGAHSIDAPYPGYHDDWRATISWRLSL